jgi:hypothetical protein
MDNASDSDGDAIGTEKEIEGTGSTDEAVLIVEKPTEQNEVGRVEELGEEREAEKCLGNGNGEYAPVERVDKEVEMGGTEMVDIQPLAIMGAGGTHSVSPDWVLEFCQELGLICDGHEEDLLALFSAIKANTHNKRGGSD